MRGLWNFVVLAWLATFAASAPVNTDVEDGAVPPNLTPDDVRAMKGTYFLKFYSPYCGHCKALAPKWDAAFREVGGLETTGFQWASVDCVQFSDFCAEEAVTAYPSLRVYRNGKRKHELSSNSPSTQDMRYFAEQYIALGDAALSPDYETAPAEMASLESAERQEEKAEKEKSDASVIPQAARSTTDEQTDSTKLTKWSGNEIDGNEAIGRWAVLFVGPDCEECGPILTKWENHENFARDFTSVNWAVVDCGVSPQLCDRYEISAYPSISIFDDGLKVYTYTGGTQSVELRTFVKHAAEAKTFDNFDLEDLENTANSANFDAGNDAGNQPELAGPTEDPLYMSGPVAIKPDYQGIKPKISDVVKFALDTLGQPLDEDPGKLIFGDSPEANHNFRTWSAPNAPPPTFMGAGELATYADGKVRELHGAELENLVKKGREPWLVKFYSPACPHCVTLAPIYESVAAKLSNKVNVAAVNCETNQRICEDEGITSWPTITIYRGASSIDAFKGHRSEENLLEYSQRAHTAQIYPLEGQKELVKEIVANMDHNMTTFVYLYDESVMIEDWQSLGTVASEISSWGGKIYRSNSSDLRELAGIKHRGTAFISVDLSGDTLTGKLKWYDYPYSNVPKKIRNAKEVSAWAYRAKWSSLQYLDPVAITEFSPYIAVLITEGNQLPSKDKLLLEHKRMSLEFRDFYRERQIEDQDKMRVDRLKQQDRALRNQEYRKARKIMEQPLNNAVSVDLAFAYVPISVWKDHYARYVDVSEHQVGQVVILDFYNAVYLDKVNQVAIRDQKAVLDDSAELLRRYYFKEPKTSYKSVRKFYRSYPRVPRPSYRSTHFHSDESSSGHPMIANFFQALVVISVLYLIYRKFLRAKLRSFAERKSASSSEEWSNNAVYNSGKRE